MAETVILPIATCGVCGDEEFRIRFVPKHVVLICTSCGAQNELRALGENRKPLFSKLSQRLARLMRGLTWRSRASDDEACLLLDGGILYELLMKATGQECPDGCLTAVSQDGSRYFTETGDWTGHSVDIFRVVMRND